MKTGREVVLVTHNSFSIPIKDMTTIYSFQRTKDKFRCVRTCGLAYDNKFGSCLSKEATASSDEKIQSGGHAYSSSGAHVTRSVIG